MYPRLRLVRNLLKDKGIIFISIDDRELTNLRKICDNVVRENNFIDVYIKQSKVGGFNSKFIVKKHEYALVYSKTLSATKEMYIPHEESYLTLYREEDRKGRYFWDTFARLRLRNPIIYDIEAPDGALLRNGWIWSESRYQKKMVR